jgi:predicted DNA-binding protein
MTTTSLTEQGARSTGQREVTPLPQSFRIVSAHLPASLADRLRARADADDRTVSYVVRKLIEAEIENGDAPAKSAAAKSSAVRKPKRVRS